MRSSIAFPCVFLLCFMAAGCDDADVASRNLSKAADNFEVARRVVFINGITDEVLLEIMGRCNVERTRSEWKSPALAVTCDAGGDEYRKHYLGLSDNVTYLVEQLDATNVSVNHYRLTFKPQAVVPDFDARGDAADMLPGTNQGEQ